MNELDERINLLEETVTDLKKELRRIKSVINKFDKLGLVPPPEILFKKEDVESTLKERKEELKALKKVVKLIK